MTFVNENLTVRAIIFSKNTKLRLPLPQDFKKPLLIKVSIKKFL